MYLSVVIPVYNSSNTLADLTDRLMDTLTSLGQEFEIIFVEDGGGDSSWEVLCKLQQHYPENVIAIQLMRNFGQHNALMAGLRKSSGQYVVTMDDDLQNPPEEITKLVEAIENSEYDLVYGNYGEKKHASWRNIGSFLALLFFRHIFKITVYATSFRIIRRELLRCIFSYNLNYTYIDGLLAWNTTRIGDVLVEHDSRVSGKSGYSLSKLILLSLNLITNFSLLPLQVVSTLGFVTAVGGFVTGTYYIGQALLSDISVPGYASTIVAIMLLGGAQLLALGMLGEYVGRMHINVNRKPQYAIRHIISCGVDRGAEGDAANDVRFGIGND